MGYYTDVYFDGVELKAFVDVEDFKNKYKAFVKKCTGWFDDLNVDDLDNQKRSLEFNEPNRKFYEHEQFAEFLAPFVTESLINCIGEESEDRWRIEFDGKGGWKEVRGELIFDFHPYTEFIKRCGDDLPDYLKLELEKWWVIQHI